MPKIQYLIQRGKTYYIRLRVPSDLISAYDGKLEIQRSLKTRDHDEARKLVTLEKLKIEREFDDKRRSVVAESSQGDDILSSYSEYDLTQLAIKCYLDMKKAADKRAAKEAHIKADDHYHTQLQEDAALLGMEIKGTLPDNADDMGVNLALRLLEKEGIGYRLPSERFDEFTYNR